MDITELLGKTLAEVRGKVGDKEIRFVTESGESYRLYHSYKCCESVQVEDICGDLRDLTGSPIIQAEEATSNENPEGVRPKDYRYGFRDSFTWTFYKLGTAKGSVTIRWRGASNSHYSESVDFGKVARLDADSIV